MKDDNSRRSVAQHLRELVASATPGTRLPGARELQRRFGVAPLTVQQAVRSLAAEGLVDVRPGAGTFVAAPTRERRGGDLAWQQVALGGHPPYDASRSLDLHATPAEGVVRLAGGYLDPDLLPARELAAALGRAARAPGAWGRAPVEGLPALRRWFAAESGSFAPAEVLVTAGGQAALSIAVRALTRPGDPVVVESPTYAGLIAVARSHGLAIHPVPADADGLRTDLLGDVLAATGARLVVVQPLYANPTGSVLATARRAELLELARRHGAFVLEDDFARDLRIDGEQPAPLATADPDGHVVHLRSLTKSVAPGLRVAALCARGPALARLRAAKTLDDFYVPAALQAAAADFLVSPAWPRHRRTVARELGLRRDALLTALDRLLPELEVTARPRGGMHAWVRLPDHLPDQPDDRTVAERARGAGVLVSPGRAWFPAEPEAAYLRLTYGETSPEEIVEGVRRLATVVTEPGAR
ncbi:MAG: PLP-dependent aminotransferase family protein [Nocardioides sp.]|nr:PLP-dependent aminotransferase family protein [Nocardioidaceae bacterium]MCB8957415.1 PLP-dependent aminotransferase family protein [Nocardioides sp.]